MWRPWPTGGLSRQKQTNNIKLTKLHKYALYVFEYWYSLKNAANYSRNVKECCRVHDWVQFVGDRLVYGFTSFTKNEIYLVSKNACLNVVWPNVYNFLVLWYVDTSLHNPSTRKHREHSARIWDGALGCLVYDPCWWLIMFTESSPTSILQKWLGLDTQ